MNKCCEHFLDNVTPNQPQEGLFTEIHECPTCKQKFEITFEGHPVLGGKFICAVSDVKEI